MDQTLKYGSWTMSGTAGGRIGANSCAEACRASSAKIRVRVNRNPRYSIISLTLFREIRGRQIREEFHGLTWRGIAATHHEDTKTRRIAKDFFASSCLRGEIFLVAALVLRVHLWSLASFWRETSPAGATQESPGRKPWEQAQ